MNSTPEPPGNAEPQLGITSHGITSPNTVPAAKGWYSRGYLPHCDSIGLLQSITFRLADSLPQEKLKQLEEELKIMERNAELGLGAPRGRSFNIEVEKRKRIEGWLDAGMGCCALRHPQMAQVTQETLLISDGEKYLLLAWCIMPNHVHVLIEPKVPVWKIVQSWKSYTGRWAMAHNADLGLGVPKKEFWMRDYWDRYIRDENHFHSTVAYIHDNPVKASLCKSSHDWCWSSAKLFKLPS
jgi:putative transposase